MTRHVPSFSGSDYPERTLDFASDPLSGNVLGETGRRLSATSHLTEDPLDLATIALFLADDETARVFTAPDLPSTGRTASSTTRMLLGAAGAIVAQRPTGDAEDFLTEMGFVLSKAGSQYGVVGALVRNPSPPNASRIWASIGRDSEAGDLALLVFGYPVDEIEAEQAAVLCAESDELAPGTEELDSLFWHALRGNDARAGAAARRALNATAQRLKLSPEMDASRWLARQLLWGAPSSQFDIALRDGSLEKQIGEVIQSLQLSTSEEVETVRTGLRVLALKSASEPPPTDESLAREIEQLGEAAAPASQIKGLAQDHPLQKVATLVSRFFDSAQKDMASGDQFEAHLVLIQTELSTIRTTYLSGDKDVATSDVDSWVTAAENLLDRYLEWGPLAAIDYRLRRAMAMASGHSKASWTLEPEVIADIDRDLEIAKLRHHLLVEDTDAEYPSFTHWLDAIEREIRKKAEPGTDRHTGAEALVPGERGDLLQVWAALRGNDSPRKVVPCEEPFVPCSAAPSITEPAGYIRYEDLTMEEMRTTPGAVVIVRIDRLAGFHFFEDQYGYLFRLHEGDVLSFVLGDRYAPLACHAACPDTLPRTAQFVVPSGIISEVLEYNQVYGEDTDVEILGLAVDEKGAFLRQTPSQVDRSTGLLLPPGQPSIENETTAVATPTTLSRTRSHRSPKPRATILLGTGGEMDDGKSTMLRTACEELSQAGHQVVALKISGTASLKDIYYMLEAGASEIGDFVSLFGDTDTTRLTQEEMIARFHHVVREIAEKNANAVVLIEIADGIAQEQATYLLNEMLGNGDEIAPMIDGLLVASSSPAAAAGLLNKLYDNHGKNMPPVILGGKVANNVTGLDNEFPEYLDPGVDVPRVLNSHDPESDLVGNTFGIEPPAEIRPINRRSYQKTTPLGYPGALAKPYMTYPAEKAERISLERNQLRRSIENALAGTTRGLDRFLNIRGDGPLGPWPLLGRLEYAAACTALYEMQPDEYLLFIRNFSEAYEMHPFHVASRLVEVLTEWEAARWHTQTNAVVELLVNATGFSQQALEEAAFPFGRPDFDRTARSVQAEKSLAALFEGVMLHQNPREVNTSIEAWFSAHYAVREPSGAQYIGIADTLRRACVRALINPEAIPFLVELDSRIQWPEPKPTFREIGAAGVPITAATSEVRGMTAEPTSAAEALKTKIDGDILEALQSIDWPLMSIADLRKDQIDAVLRLANVIAEGELPEPLPRKILGLAFFDDSNRTSAGYEAAAERLGWVSVDITLHRKHERPMDVIRTLGGSEDSPLTYADVVVARFREELYLDYSEEEDQKLFLPWDEARERIAKDVQARLINGGTTGPEQEHPSQTLIDMFAFERLLPEAKTLTLIGDPGLRAARSLILGNKVCENRWDTTVLTHPDLVTPDQKVWLEQNGVCVILEDIRAELTGTPPDILYVVGMKDGQPPYPARNSLIVDQEMIEMLPDTRFFSPMPLLDEMSPEALHNHPRSMAFAQSDLGLFVRMALLVAAVL